MGDEMPLPFIQLLPVGDILLEGKQFIKKIKVRFNVFFLFTCISKMSVQCKYVCGNPFTKTSYFYMSIKYIIHYIFNCLPLNLLPIGLITEIKNKQKKT